MIKKRLLGVLVGLFALVGVSFATNYEQEFPIGLDKFASHLNSNYDVGVLPKGRFITNYLGDSKNLLAFNSQELIFRDINNRLYLFSMAHGEWQGEFQYFQVCEVADWTNGMQNCGSPELIGNSEYTLSNYLNGLKAGDVVYYRNNLETWAYWGSPRGCHYVVLCLQQTGQSALCYSATRMLNGESAVSQCGAIYHTPIGTSLSFNTETTTFSSINRAYLGDSPGNVGIGGGVIDTTPTTGNTVVEPGTVGGGNNVVSCSNQMAIDYYTARGYTPNLCYAGVSYTGTGVYNGTITPGTGIEYSDLWFDFGQYYANGEIGEMMSYEKFFGYWRNQYKLYKDGGMTLDSYNPFTNVPYAIKMYFYLVDKYGNTFDNRTIVDYCYTYVDLYSYDEYNGALKNQICSVSNVIGNNNNNNNSGGGSSGTGGSSGGGIVGGGNGTITSSGTVIGGNVIGLIGDSGLGHGSAGASGSVRNPTTYIDGTSFISDFLDTMRELNIIPSKSDFGLGILPSYIIVAFLGIILFRFFSK